MRISLIEINNFRGIKHLRWAPSAGMNCLIGPGDSTKTTILDAIEWTLNPRIHPYADDSDFFNLDFTTPVRITVTLTDLPTDFLADNHYGLYLRSWDPSLLQISDEPREDLPEALSIALSIDESLEARWFIYNDRVGYDNVDPPSVRYKDAPLLGTSRLGPYAERHLAWGRSSVLTHLGQAQDKPNLDLARAARAARQSFSEADHHIFSDVASIAQKLAKDFAVPIRDSFVAELDVQSVTLSTGGISLHDRGLPLRRLGTGSSRLLVSALQHASRDSNITLIDEIEHGLEPHRISRLLRHLKTPPDGTRLSPPQIFLTTHSPTVIRELNAQEIFSVTSEEGTTSVHSMVSASNPYDAIQRHLRSTPEAFLARKVAIGEGRTEQGLMRGLDDFWIGQGKNSYAYQGIVPIDGGGNPDDLAIAEHLLNLGHRIFLLLDSDSPPDSSRLHQIEDLGGNYLLWPDECSTEQRIFLDVPWATVVELLRFASECLSTESVIHAIKVCLPGSAATKIADLELPDDLDQPEFRKMLGKAATNKNHPWFKDIARGQGLARIIGPVLAQIRSTPLAKSIDKYRVWVDD